MTRLLILLGWFLGSVAYAATGDTPASLDHPTHAQILHVLVTANQAEVDDGKVAATKASHAKVKEFANKMVTEHTAALDKLKALSTKMGWKPEDNALSQKMMKEEQDAKAKLAAMDGMGFDKAYIELQVKQHKDLLDVIDNKLLPNVTDPTLKKEVQDTRGVVAMHLEHAQQLQTEINKS